MKNLIKKILKESKEEKLNKFYQNIVSTLKPPYFKNLKDYILDDNEIKLVLSLIFKEPIGLKVKDGEVFDKNNNVIYKEYRGGEWIKRKFDKKGNMTYYEESDGDWCLLQYDERGNEIYSELSNGSWEKNEYDERGNLTYRENSNGEWVKFVYDERNRKIYNEYYDGELEKFEYDEMGELINVVTII